MWHLLNCDGVITNKKTVITMTDNKKEQERNDCTAYHLGDSGRDEGQRGWFGLQVVYTRYPFLPIHQREHHQLHQPWRMGERQHRFRLCRP